MLVMAALLMADDLYEQRKRVADLEAGLEVTRHVLHRFGVEARQIQLLLQRLRLGS